MSGKPPAPAVLAKLEDEVRRACLALPGAIHEIVWGNPCFKLKGKIFCTSSRRADHVLVTTKLTRPEQDLVLADPIVRPAEYVGRHGWIDIRLSSRRDLPKVKAWIGRSYELVAGKAGGSRRKR